MNQVRPKFNEVHIWKNVRFYILYAEYHSYWQMFVVSNTNMPKLPDNSFTIPAYWYHLKEDKIFEQYEIKKKSDRISLL